MEWKVILKYSGIIGVIIGLLNEVYWSLDPGLLVGGLIATGLILNRKLKKDDWGIFVGVLVTIVVYDIMLTLLDLVLG
ncbi:MAG: hypothetical protein IH845_02460 [Nanoarchaeota archaeon]|nr:hypothetical protein [Nanoarchaeota archaeon]